MFITFQPITIKIYLLLFASTLIFGCASVDTDKIENLNKGKILKMGHAGLGFTSLILPFNPYPSNGVTALKKAIEYNADGLEVDLQMTKDSVLVLYHDMTLEGSTNMEGCIQEMSWHEIKDAEYKMGLFFDLFHSDKILRLDSLLSWCQKLDTFPHLHFDTRIYNMCDDARPHSMQMGPLLLQILKDYRVPEDKILIISSTRVFVEYLQTFQHPFRISYEETSDFDKGLKYVLDRGLASLTIKPMLLTESKVAEAHKKNIKIVTFGAKSRSGNAKLIRLNPDVIHSNNVRVLIDLLDN